MKNTLKRRVFLAIYPFFLHHRQILMMVLWPLTKLYALGYKGNAVFCPCCEGNFRKFLRFGASQREGALCPGCFALERHRMMWLYFKERTSLLTGNLKLLHVAPEFIFQRRFKAIKNLDYLSSDLRPTEAMVQMDITDIRLPDDTFDAIYCSHVFEHIPDDRKAMHELRRVLKPGGWAILLVPLDRRMAQTHEGTPGMTPIDREKHFGHHDHQRLYGLDYKERLEEAGFEVRVDQFGLEFDPLQAKRLGLIPEEAIYYCSKPQAARHEIPAAEATSSY